MKKLFSILLVIILSFSLVACDPAAPPDESHPIGPIVNKQTQDEEVVAFLYEVLEDSFEGGTVIIYVEDNTAYIDIYQPGLANSLSELILAGTHEPWNEIVELAETSSADLHNLLLAQNQDYDLAFSICDNVNNEATKFITCINGEVVFNMLAAVIESGEL